MKILRVRFRSLYIFCVVATLTMVVIYLPPSYRPSQLLLANSTSSVRVATAGVNVLHLRKVLPEAPLPAPTNEELRLKLPALKREGFGGNGILSSLTSPVKGDHKNTPHEGALPSRAPSPLDKIIQESGSEGVHHLQDANEHNPYVQDYGDYTPAGFVEVQKEKVGVAGSEAAKPDAILSGHRENANAETAKKTAKTKKKAAVFKTGLYYEDAHVSPQYLPETLRTRALTYSNTSSLRAFLREQDRRAEHVTNMCDTFVPSKSAVANIGMGPPPGLSGLHNLLIDRTNHIAYCPVYKAASTTWTITLLEIEGIWDKEHRQKNQRLQQIVGQVFPKISNFAGPSLTQGMTRFMVVRHPFERLLSCYRDKFESAKKVYYYTRYGQKMVRHYRRFEKYLTVPQIAMLQEQVHAKVKAGVPVVLPGNPFAEPLGPTFREFVQYVTHAKHDDEHWRTYFNHCSPCHMKYQFILRFEDLNQEGKEFLEYLNRTSQVQMRWENPTNGGATNDFICKYYSQLTTQMMNDLINKYEKDFILYEYKPDAYLKCANNSANIESEYSGPYPYQTTLGHPDRKRK